MGRRTFLGLTADLALGVGGLAACSSPGPSGARRPRSLAASSAPASAPLVTSPAPTTSTSAVVPNSPGPAMDFRQLEASLAGHVVRPGNGGYPAARMVYDLAYSGETPVAVAYCTSPEDVARCVDFATRSGVTPIPRCGGHSYGGYSTGPGLIIDVTAMNGFEMTGPATAEVGAGTLLVDLYARCAAAGVLIPGGSCPTVGLSGLALGGGMGVVGRRYGLTCDNVTGVEVVTADGRIVRCDEETEPDLFWACRGGGGRNFGIATSFGFATHPAPPLSLFALEWAWARVPEVVAAWQTWITGAPPELWSNCQLLYQGTSGPTVRCSGVFTGAVPGLRSLLGQFLSSTGPPRSSWVAESSYLSAMLAEAGCAGLRPDQCHLSGQTVAGLLPRALFRARSAFVGQAFSDQALRAAMDVFASLEAERSPLGAAILFDAMGGAINLVEPQATAFVHRSALCSVQMITTFAPNSPESEVAHGVAWLGQAHAMLAPYCNGEAYQNYIDPDLTGWAEAYYGANLPRLQDVKRHYDPDGVFGFPQGITDGPTV